MVTCSKSAVYSRHLDGQRSQDEYKPGTNIKGPSDSEEILKNSFSKNSNSLKLFRFLND